MDKITEAPAVATPDDSEALPATLDDFLAAFEQRAYRIAHIALRDHDEALDVVQDSMIKLVSNYAERPPHEWRTLFFTIVHNRITDSHRKKTLHGRLFGWFERASRYEDDDDGAQPLARASQPGNTQPLETLQRQQTMGQLEQVLENLPLRQQQAFWLRMVEELDTRSTAEVMQCSSGSVKTHLSRALATLKANLQEHYES